MSVDHPLIRRQDAIARLRDISPAERLVLFAVARYGDWDTGASCYPTVETMMDYTGLNRRTVQRALRHMTCSRPVRTRTGWAPCLACGHLDLLLLERAGTPNASASYIVVADASAAPRLPEVIPSTSARGQTRERTGAAS